MKTTVHSSSENLILLSFSVAGLPDSFENVKLLHPYRFFFVVSLSEAAALSRCNSSRFLNPEAASVTAAAAVP